MSSLEAYIDRFYKTGEIDQTFAELVEEFDLLGWYAHLGYFVADPDRSDFYAGHLEDYVPSARLDELYDGAEPTDEELSQWRNRVIESNFEDMAGLMVAIYRLEGNIGKVMWGATLHGDNGEIERSYGPFKSETELTETLSRNGTFRKE